MLGQCVTCVWLLESFEPPLQRSTGSLRLVSPSVTHNSLAIRLRDRFDDESACFDIRPRHGLRHKPSTEATNLRFEFGLHAGERQYILAGQQSNGDTSA